MTYKDLEHLLVLRDLVWWQVVRVGLGVLGRLQQGTAHIKSAIALGVRGVIRPI